MSVERDQKMITHWEAYAMSRLKVLTDDEKKELSDKIHSLISSYGASVYDGAHLLMELTVFALLYGAAQCEQPAGEAYKAAQDRLDEVLATFRVACPDDSYSHIVYMNEPPEKEGGS